MKKKLTRILSGTLAAIMVGQVLIFGDGSQGTAFASAIEEIKDSIQLSKNADELANEFEDAVEGLGEVDYFELPEFSRMRSASGEISISNSLTMSGRVELLDGRDHTKVKVLIFDGWNLAAETYADANGYFEVTAYGLGAETNVKIECDGYLPRFYKGMGYGSYDVGTNVLYPGDTTYNEWENNAWSDEQINENDLTFVASLIGKRKAVGTYDEMLDLNDDGSIDEFDLEIIEEYIADESENKEFIEEYDFNDDMKLMSMIVIY
jgi:hypothetical protein